MLLGDKFDEYEWWGTTKHRNSSVDRLYHNPKELKRFFIELENVWARYLDRVKYFSVRRQHRNFGTDHSVLCRIWNKLLKNDFILRY